MSSTHASTEVEQTSRFRAPTIESALAEARAQLGDVEIVEANRIRRGGVGGFFATDLGVELVVRASPSPAARRPGNTADEYLDSAAPSIALPRSTHRSDTDDRWPPFYDRVREESTAREPITAELERLLTSASETEQAAHGQVRPADRSFAEHLALHLVEDDPPVEKPKRTLGTPSRAVPRSTRRRAKTQIASPEVVDSAPADDAGLVADATPPTPSSEPAPPRRRSALASVPARGTVEDVHEPDHQSDHASDDATDEQSAIHVEAVDPAPTRTAEEVAPEEQATAGAHAPVAGTNPIAGRAASDASAADTPDAIPRKRSRQATPTGRDPWRKSIDLAAGAVGRLVEQLSDVTPVEGSRMHTLSRLTVSVTTPDGAVIDLTAELDGDHR